MSDDIPSIRLTGAIAGIVSGLTKVAVGHGFDTVKTRLQTAAPGISSSDVLTRLIKSVLEFFPCISPVLDHVYSRQEGFLALYKGAATPALSTSLIDSVMMGSMYNYRLFLQGNASMIDDSLTDGRPSLSLLGHGVAGFLGGITSSLLSTPMELLKIKLQLQMQRSVSERQFKGPIDCAREIYCLEGFGGLYAGFSGSLAFRSNYFWMFLSFEGFKRAFARLRGTPYELSVGTTTFLSGGLASLTFWTMAIPADNIKNRIMAHPFPSLYGPVTDRPTFISMARRIYSREGGLKGFYRGLGLALVRAFPVNAAALFVYEGLLTRLDAEK
ncbi:mitochondrial carrier [Mycena floridula]|nr:mitochondrial carrier [Mycena floridula]